VNVWFWYVADALPSGPAQGTARRAGWAAGQAAVQVV